MRFAGLRRRNFLTCAARAAGAFLLTPGLRKAAFARDSQYQNPHYREQTLLDAALLQVKPGRDGFINEQYHDKIAAVLEGWSESLIVSPQSRQALEKALSVAFTGTSWQPVESRRLRPLSRALEVRRLRFDSQPSLKVDVFLRELESAVSVFSKIFTADFQVTSIDASSSGLQTRVRYELVGTGPGFYREQWVGDWSLDWETSLQDTFHMVRWQAHDEVRSRATEPYFADITHAAFGGNSSYASQMLHGADYWRTVLDGASGIDIYGHNGVSVGDIDGDGYDDVYVCQPAGLPTGCFATAVMGRLKTLPNRPVLEFLTTRRVLCSRISTTTDGRILSSCAPVGRCCL
jgi:hypothetical protein